MESDDVHITLTNYNYTENTEIGAINSALKQVSNLESVDKRDFRRHVFNQAVKDYKEIDAADANKASEYLSGESEKLTKGNAEALTRVLTKYKEKYTALKDSVSEESLKNYFTDNYNDLNPLFGGRNGELPDPQSIKGLSKDALINLAITARNSLNSRIDIKGKEASPEEYRALLSKYLGIKKDVPSMRKFIEGLNEEEFALYSSFRNDFCSKRYILGELSQHELMSVAEVGSSRASSYITPDTYNKFFEKYKPEEKDLNKQKEFINSLSIDELVLCGLSSKEELLKRVAGNTKNEQPLKDLLNVKSLAADNLRIYLTNIQDPKSRIEKIDALPEKTKKILKEEGQLSITTRGDIRLYDIYPSAYIYVNKAEVVETDYRGLLGVSKSDNRANDLLDAYWIRLRDEAGKDRVFFNDNLLDVSENMRKLKSSAGVSTINQMLELIYKSEDQAKTDKSPTNWHSAMKKRIVDILLSKDEVELKTRMQEFKNYLNEADHAVNHIILGWYNQSQNKADTQTEALPSQVIRILNESVFQP